MRACLLILATACITGCASKSGMIASDPPASATSRYDNATCAALVFDPPVTAGDPKLELSRDERQPSAFVSFDGPSTTYYWIQTDDLQVSDWNGSSLGASGDRYQRRALMEKSGVTYR